MRKKSIKRYAQYNRIHRSLKKIHRNRMHTVLTSYRRSYQEYEEVNMPWLTLTSDNSLDQLATTYVTGVLTVGESCWPIV